MQFRTQNVLEHGEAVLAKYQTLLSYAQEGLLPEGWREPKWWSATDAILLAYSQPAPAVMEQYLRFHDCGKPLCRTLDEEGRQHFPDHARISAQCWAELGGSSDVCWLMANDMMLHTGTAIDCEALRGHALTPALMFAALAEIHANAEMFGGIESNGFKAKAKHLERRTAQLLSR